MFTGQWRRRSKWVRGAVVAWAALHAAAAGAQNPASYPSRPIRIVIGFAAGGGTDVVLRAIASKMSGILKTPVVVDNKPGANGNLAAEAVLKAPADGYTLLYNTSSIVLNASLYPKLDFDPLKDFAPITATVNSPLVLVVRPTLPDRSIQDLIARAKARPDELTYGSAGIGNITHLANVLFQNTVGMRSRHIAYKSEAFAMTDVAGGHVDFYFGTAPGVAPMVKEKRLHALAVASRRRLQTLPDVPTFEESGIPGIVLGSWSGIVAPAGTPAPIVDRLNAVIRQALADPALSATLASQSAEILGSSPAEYGAYLREEMERWGKIIRAEGIKAE
ncbi:tripartite tricarboxylate transporter substrate binding protein [Pigmentiphaga soli]|uniref:Tripartite tricarboxylate transporter substrate binding protein n=1 Tax=Pigmentiphaga soli TaxID=1007095 RepID=A0ABP8HJE0_9BURK